MKGDKRDESENIFLFYWKANFAGPAFSGVDNERKRFQ